MHPELLSNWNSLSGTFWDTSKRAIWVWLMANPVGLRKHSSTLPGRYGPLIQILLLMLQIAVLDEGPPHSVWKSQNKSHSTLRAKRATFTFWVDKSWLKMPKMVHFCEFLKTWSLRSNSVTRQVSFNRTIIGGKCQNSKIQMRHFE